MADRTSPFWPSALFLVVASALFCAPLFANLDDWGRQDWDQFWFRYETPRLALLRDHVLPAWNPYAEGGTVLLAHPDSPVLSPWYLIVLLLGTPLGLRVQVVTFMAIGAVGMAALLGRLGASRPAGILGGIVFVMSSHFVLHMAEGHVEWCVIGLMPWLALYALRDDDGLRGIIGAALLLASVLTFGSVYIPAVYLPFLGVWMAFESIRSRRWTPIARWTAIVALALVLSSAKLLPTVEFAQSYPRADALGHEGTARRVLLAGLFDPRQALLYRTYRDEVQDDGNFPGIGTEAGSTPLNDYINRLWFEWNFHEYGCYIGLVGIVLAAWGAIRGLPRHWPLYVTGLLTGIVVLGNVSPVDLWNALGYLPLYGQLHVPSRFLAGVIFVLAVAAALGLDALWSGSPKAWHRWRPGITAGLIMALYAELAATGWPLFRDTFVIQPVAVERHAQFAQRPSPIPVPDIPRSATNGSMYAQLLGNSGTLNAYENLAVAHGKVKKTDDADYRGEVYLQAEHGTVQVVRWTMSSVRVRLELSQADELVLNQNFDDHWMARRENRGGRSEVVGAHKNADGLIALAVEPGRQEIEFFYHPWSFVVGAWISGAALALCAAALWMTRASKIETTRTRA
ncbi:MAG: hypothetical protein ACRD2N_02820 [Vicinamibacterales bacterium]